MSIEKVNRKKVYQLCLKIKNEKIINIFLFIFLTSCTSMSQFGAGVDITFDPRTIGMQIDDAIMQKSLATRLALKDKNIFYQFSLK